MNQSQDQTISRLSHQSHALWREPSFDQLISRFQKILETDHQVAWVSHYILEKNGRKITLQRQPQIPRGTRCLPAPVQQQLIELCQGPGHQKGGLHQITISEHQVRFFWLRDTNHRRRLIAWIHPNVEASAPNNFSIIDFLVQQLQSSSKWFNRLEKTQALLHTDDLTGLYNYRYLDLCLETEIRRAQRFQTSFCLLFIDLDNFKPVNDVHGHLAGSQVLKQMADVLRECLREVDTIFRYGGDEFVVLLLETNRDTGTMAAERVRGLIAKHRFTVNKDECVQLTASIGVSICPEHSVEKEKLLNLADFCMYKSKRSGKNRVFVTNSGDDSQGNEIKTEGHREPSK